MSPKPFTENSQREYTTTDDGEAREVRALVRRPTANTIICSIVIIALVAAIALVYPGLARAREGMTPKPILRPVGLLQAKRECSRSTPLVECRAALRRALAAVEWQRHERLHQGSFGVQHALRLASAMFNVPLRELKAVGVCESHLTPTSKNRTSTASGVFQFLDSTWARAGVPGFSVFDPYANILAAARLVHNDGSWREWSCKP